MPFFSKGNFPETCDKERGEINFFSGESRVILVFGLVCEGLAK
jgi:hypothetical protein